MPSYAAVLREASRPDWAQDGIGHSVVARLGWRDRLRVLIGRPLHVETFAWTESRIGRYANRPSQVYAEPARPAWLRRQPLGASDSLATGPQPEEGRDGD